MNWSGLDCYSRVFKHHSHSKTAEFLKDLGYDEKYALFVIRLRDRNLISPNVEVPTPIGMVVYYVFDILDESKATTLTQKTVMENAFISTFVNSAYVIYGMHSIYTRIVITRYRFFPRTNSLAVKQYDDKLITITIANPDNVEQGRIHHIRGTLKEVLTAIRKVNVTYQYTDKYKTGEIEKLVSLVENAGGAYHGSVVVIHGTGVPNKMDYGGNGSVFKKSSDVMDKQPSPSITTSSSSSSSSLPTTTTTTESSSTMKLKRQQQQMQKQEEQHRMQEAMLLAARLEREQREVRGYDKRMEKNANSMEQDYHGTGIAPAERDEREHYHGTGIAPAERDEKEHYHGTGIAPAEQDDFEQITSWNDNHFDVNKYIQRENGWGKQQDQDREDFSTRYSGRYVSHVDRRREERRHQPAKHRTWEDIRRQS